MQEENNQENKEVVEKEEESEEKAYIDIKYFAKVEVSVGEIIECEKIANADRLLKLKVDFGTEQRQIISGIAEFYQPEELIGKKCPFVINLKPRMLKGLESNGMIMAAKDEENFSLLEINTVIKNGTRIS